MATHWQLFRATLHRLLFFFQLFLLTEPTAGEPSLERNLIAINGISALLELLSM